MKNSFVRFDFDRLSLAEACAIIMARPPAADFAYCVTPNVDHVVRFHRQPAPLLDRAYAAADLCLCDSRILALLARRRGVDLTVVPGSDLTRALLDQADADASSVNLVGGTPVQLEKLRARYPRLALRQHCPPMGLLHDPAAMAAAADFIRTAPARLTLIAVGSPQQELLALHALNTDGCSGFGLCIGASVEFLVGEKQRAPLWMQRASLEWLFRLLAEPRRLWRRYLVDGPRIIGIVRRWRP